MPTKTPNSNQSTNKQPNAIKVKGLHGRVFLVFALLVLLGVYIQMRIVGLQFFGNEKWVKMIKDQMQQERYIEPVRGDICDEHGRIMATSFPIYEVRFDTRCTSNEVFDRNVDSLAICLAKLFGDKSRQEYKNLLVKARIEGKRNLFVHRADYIQLKQMKNFPIFRLGRFKGGFIANAENVRKMPFKSLARRTIGYKLKDGTRIGLEDAYDKELTGERGTYFAYRIEGGTWVPVYSENTTEAKDGYDVITTIDIDLQDVAHSALLQQLRKHNAGYGTTILMEVATGDIKAIVNLTKVDEGEYAETYNYAIGTSAEPGSTIKLASLIVGLEDGCFDLQDTVQTGNGMYRIYNHVIRDTKPHGTITVKESLEMSSNVGVAKLILKHYRKDPNRFIDKLYQMSLGAPLGIEIKGEGEPMIIRPSNKFWSGVSLAQMAYGYELRQTPLQILTFYNAVANGGKMMKPRFVKQIQDHGRVVRRINTQVINPSICSKSTIKKAQEMLEGVVENGTAKNLSNSNYKIAGKTGTAQIANRSGGYIHEGHKTYNGSFVGYFPADNPKYSCIVVVSAPTSGVYTGNLAAGPVFKAIADRVYATNRDLNNGKRITDSIAPSEFIPVTKDGWAKDTRFLVNKLNIPYSQENAKGDWVSTTKTDSMIRLATRNQPENAVPNVKGMGLKDAVFLLENKGLRVKVEGRGAVRQQSIAPGSLYRNGDVITLKLS
ncbi:MAG: transpeptidase family protein [Salinivirgaceae bacterium]|nr:transpeptidase family protein [Salinivirgaceae bacterium]